LISFKKLQHQQLQEEGKYLPAIHSCNQSNVIGCLFSCSFVSAIVLRYKTYSFLDRGPGLIRIVRVHMLDHLQGVRSEILLVNLALLIDHKGHYSRPAPV